MTVLAELEITQDLNTPGGQFAQEHPCDHTETHPDRQIAFEQIQSLYREERLEDLSIAISMIGTPSCFIRHTLALSARMKALMNLPSA